MDLSSINQIVKAIGTPRISEFGQNRLSRSAIPGFGYLFMSLRLNSLMLYTSVENLGAESKYYPKFIEMLLNAEVSGGRFNNIRATFDSATNVLWLCYDINTSDINAESLKDTILTFVDNAKSFRKFLKTQFIDAVLQTIRETLGKKDSEEFLLSPDDEEIYALSLSHLNENQEKNFNDGISLEATPEVMEQIRKTIMSTSGSSSVSTGSQSTESGAENATASNKSGEPELINVMIAQSMFMLV